MGFLGVPVDKKAPSEADVQQKWQEQHFDQALEDSLQNIGNRQPANADMDNPIYNDRIVET